MHRETLIKEMFDAGAHIGYSKSKRHPSTKDYIYTTKNKKDIIDLEKTADQMQEALSFLVDIKNRGAQVLFVGTKAEAKGIIRTQAELIGMPYVSERWLGGTLTNQKEMRKRIERLKELSEQAELGELVAATKKEKLMLEREIERLERKFGGLKDMEKLPAVLFIIDPKKEEIAVTEALQMNIPVIALANTDCNVSIINYPIVANDTNVSSISFFVKKIVDALK